MKLNRFKLIKWVHSSHNLLLTMIISFYSLGSFANVLVITAAPFIQNSLQVSVFVISLLLGAFPLGFAFGNLFFGREINFYGTSRVFAAGVLLLLGASITSYFSVNSIQLLVIFYFCMAVGVSGIALACTVLLYQIARGNNTRLARYYSLQFFSYLVGEVFTLLVATYLIIRFGWPSIYLTTGALTALVGLAFWSNVHFHPMRPLHQRQKTPHGNLRLLRNLTFVEYTLVGIFNYIWLYIYFVGAPYALRFVFLIPTLNYGLLLTTCLITALIASLANILLVRHYSLSSILLASVIVTCLTSAMFILAVWTQFLVFECFVLTILIMNFSVTITMTNTLSLALLACHQSVAGPAAGVYGFCTSVAGFISSLATGYILALPFDDLLSLAIWLAVPSVLTLILCLHTASNRRIARTKFAQKQ